LVALKGLLLAGGHGTRLRPLTYTGNKHMLPIANKPMLLYGLEQLVSAGIKDIAVILGPIKEGVVETIGDGSKFGADVTYIEQPEPKGLAHAVMISEDFMDGDEFVMYLGDNLLKEGVGTFVHSFKSNNLDALVGVYPVKDPSRFGIVERDDSGRLRFAEKPKQPKSNLALIGVYVFGSAVFDAVKGIKPSWRNELEITDAIQYMVDKGKRVEVLNVNGWWKDTGKPEDLLEANQLILSDLKGEIKGELSEETAYTGSLTMGEGSKTIGRVNIRGPVIIGKDCTIGPNVYIGPYTSIGDECILRNTEIENSIVMKGCRIESGKRIVDSLIGNYSTVVDSNASVPQGHRLVIGERSFAQL
jgi:glucose-1-phosphate thymidylyltransferase